ncbi:uncharacterized protein LOC122072304 [Macadamia integrifolia]|uniref:uncharacterized protein LOC122072304 n=1 Tax=Macadamia integrifolia TaxID=60698 RepID=UPI001C4FA0B0|nr:uncharacterized protein LOC122072304 [Macadamia integrifolia]
MRNKLKIQKLEDAKKRAASYFRRKSTLLREVKELSDLSSTNDVALLMFSPIPDDMPTLYTNRNKNLITLKILRKLSLKKKGHDIKINPKKFIVNGTQRIEDLAKELNNLWNELGEINDKLSKWSDPTTIDDSVVINDMEKFLVNELNQLQIKKEILMKTTAHHPWMLPQAIGSPWKACSQGMEVTSFGVNRDITQIATISGGNRRNLENGQPLPPP